MSKTDKSHTTTGQTETVSAATTSNKSKPPHREGRPVGADISNIKEEGEEGSKAGSGSSSSKEKATGDDTFAALFYNNEEAAAFKAGKAVGEEGLHNDPETIEWSQRMSKPLQ